MFKLLVKLCVLGAMGWAAQLQAEPAQASLTLEIVVGQGEHLGMVTQRYLVQPATSHLQEVAKLNKLVPPYTIYAGQKLRLPIRLMASQTAAATWLAVSGSVQVNRSAKAVVGAALQEGDHVSVPVGASAVLLLSDASQITLLGGTELVLAEHRYLIGRGGGSAAGSGTKAFAGLMRVLQGSVEAYATKASDRATPLRIQTPTSVVGVRGTQFRVGTVGPAHAITRTEVVDGAVTAQLDPQRLAGVSAGFGVLLDPAVAQVPVPVSLLAAPDLSAWSRVQDKTSMAFPSLPASLKTDVSYRVQVALASERSLAEPAQEAFSAIVFDQVFKAGEAVRVPGLADGYFLVRVRGIDPQGLEGFASTIKVTLRARPEPPLVQTPDLLKAVQNQTVQLKWATAKETDTYAIEVVDQQNGVVTVHETPKSSLELVSLPQGTYRWRVAVQSVITQNRVDTFSQLQLGARERGPWSAAASIVVLALPESASAESSEDDKQTLRLRWPDQKAPRYEVQLSRTNDFESLPSEVMTYSVDTPSITLKKLESGTHFLRYRAIEREGFIGGWSGTSKLDVPFDWTRLLMFLGGALILLP